MFILNPKLRAFFSTQSSLFTQIMALNGKVYRAVENRRTQRIQLGNEYYFLKQHFGVGWKEIFKNIVQLRLPVLSAKNEWRALQQLEKLGIRTPELMGYGCEGINPAALHSFLLTRALPPHLSLEEVCKSWVITPPAFSLKHRLIKKVAHIARTLHEHGINHRDFYLCHFLFATPTPETSVLYLIDLHRAQIRKRTPLRWIIKDLAGLYFSSHNVGLTQRDLLRFMKEYRNKSLHRILTQEATFWQKVKNRGRKLYQQHTN